MAPAAFQQTSNSRSPNNTMEDFFLAYELMESGWARATVSVGQVTHETAVSYLTSDPLGLLAQALIGFIWPEEGSVFIIQRSGQKPLDPEDLKTRRFIWDDEPGGWRWTLTPSNNKTVAVKIEQPNSSTEWRVLIDSVFSLQSMTKACVGCLESVLQKHGIVGYRISWMAGDLPLAQYLMLKRWLQFPQYDAKAAQTSTWKKDMAILKLLST